MAHRVGSLLALALSLGLLGPGRGRAQAPPPAPGTETLLAPATAPAPPLPPPASADADLAPDDPLLVAPGRAPGWFFEADTGIVKPHIKSRVSSGANLVFPAAAGGAALQPLQLPVASFDWTALPVFQVGYRLAEGAGELRARYSFFSSSSGTALIPAFDQAGTGLAFSRVGMNRIDLGYYTSEYLLDPLPGTQRTRWAGLGITAADVFFDTHAVGRQILAARTSNSFAGVGPHFDFGWAKPLPRLPLALYGRLDCTALVGKVRQHFAETVGLPDGSLASATAATGPDSDGVGIFAAEAGLGYAPARYQGRFLLSAGYQWQRWWWIGATDDSNAELTVQGAFLRMQLWY